MTKAAKITVMIFSLLLVGTLISEFVLLSQNFELKSKVSAYHQLEFLLKQLQARYDKISYETSFQGKCLPIFLQRKTYFQTNRIHNAKAPQYTLIFGFTTNDCSACLRNEIITWNKFAASYNPRIFQVFGVVDTTGLRENLEKIIHSMGVKFPVVGIANLRNHLGIKSTPAVFFCNGDSKKILYAYFPQTTKIAHDGFANKLQMILDACKE